MCPEGQNLKMKEFLIRTNLKRESVYARALLRGTVAVNAQRELNLKGRQRENLNDAGRHQLRTAKVPLVALKALVAVIQVRANLILSQTNTILIMMNL